jgi:hypothetical protein
MVTEVDGDDAVKDQTSTLTDGAATTDGTSQDSAEQDVKGQPGLQYKASPTTSMIPPTNAPCGSDAKSDLHLQKSLDVYDNDHPSDDAPPYDDGLYHPPAVPQWAPPLGPPTSGAVFRTSGGDPILLNGDVVLFDRSIYHPHDHKGKKQEESKSGDGDHLSSRKKAILHADRGTNRKHPKEKVRVKGTFL